MESVIRILVSIAAVWAVLFVWLGIPARMAQARNRHPGPWMLVSLVGSPLLAIALLLALGDDPASEPKQGGGPPDA